MPIYEYQCTECDQELEKLQKINDAPLTDCPACGKSALQKKVSAAGFRLKGNGWYETDFKSKNRKNVVKEDSKPKSGGDSSGKPSSGKSSSPGDSK